MLGLHEGNPIAKWAIEELGLGRALALRVLVGGGRARAHRRWAPSSTCRTVSIVNRACRYVLIGALGFWGVVACSNAFQIADRQLAERLGSELRWERKGRCEVGEHPRSDSANLE